MLNLPCLPRSFLSASGTVAGRKVAGRCARIRTRRDQLSDRARPTLERSSSPAHRICTSIASIFMSVQAGYAHCPCVDRSKRYHVQSLLSQTSSASLFTGDSGSDQATTHSGTAFPSCDEQSERCQRVEKSSQDELGDLKLTPVNSPYA
jgi:hypothetical protein